MTWFKGLCISIGIVVGLILFLMLSSAFFDLFSHLPVSFDPGHFICVAWEYRINPSMRDNVGMALFTAAIPCAIGFLGFFVKPSIPNIYGQARFASLREIAAAKLFRAAGIYLGHAYGEPLFQSGHEHVLLFAPTGSGKTTSLAIPNLFYWKGSCVCTDIKRSLFDLTSGYRKKLGQRIFLWNPADVNGFTHAYNPLDVIETNSLRRIESVQRIVHILIPDPAVGKEIFWTTQARMLLIGLIHYVLDHPTLSKTFGEINRLIQSSSNFSDWLVDVLAQEGLHYLSRNHFNSFLDSPETTHKNIRDTLLTYLSVFDNPLIEAATSRSDFDLRQLRKIPMTIYVGVPENALDRLAPLLSIFYEQLAQVMTAQLPDKKTEPHSVLLLMDEFGALRRMESFLSISVFREYRLRVLILVQELAQLYAQYGQFDAKRFINTKTRIAYTQIDLDTAKWVEAALGNQTIRVKQASQRLVGDWLHPPERSENIHYACRPLLMVQEIQQLPQNKAIILIEGQKPVYADKRPWYQDKILQASVCSPVKLDSMLSVAQAIFERAQRQAQASHTKIETNQNTGATAATGQAVHSDILQPMTQVVYPPSSRGPVSSDC
jgi:type IV secretion system protein VirD4